MKYLVLVFVFITNLAFAQDGKFVMINGGSDKNSNNLRYLENIRAMYSAFGSTGAKDENISVFYGSGDLEDTNIGGVSYGYVPSTTIEEKGSAESVGYSEGYDAGSDSDEGISSQKKTGPIKEKALEEDIKKEVDVRLTKEYVFSNSNKSISPAKKASLAKVFKKLSTELQKGEDLTLFITDHGSQNYGTQSGQASGGMGMPMGGFGSGAVESKVNLWGEDLTVDELNSLLSSVPEANNVRIITNICFGGGLTKLTSKNVCVMANQVDSMPSMSESLDLDVYAQNFASAIETRKDFDNDGKVTYLDAHRYASSLDNPMNHPKTSLDYFLENNKRKIDLRKKSGPDFFEPIMVCEKNSQDINSLEHALVDIEKLLSTLSPDLSSVPLSRKKYLKGRVEQDFSAFNGMEVKQRMKFLTEKVNIIKKQLKEASDKWMKMSDTQKKIFEKKSALQAQELMSQKMKLQSKIKGLKSLSLEIDFLTHADENQLEEYENIKKCLEGEYGQN